jgi:hypothetical protein
MMWKCWGNSHSQPFPRQAGRVGFSLWEKDRTGILSPLGEGLDEVSYENDFLDLSSLPKFVER